MEAIQSSLYYLHVETEEDEVVRRSFEQERITEESDTHTTPVARKPLPSTVHHPLPPLPNGTLSNYSQDWNDQQQHHDGQAAWSGDNAIHPYLDVTTDMNTHRTPKHSSAIDTGLYREAGDYALSPSIHKKSGYPSSNGARQSGWRADESTQHQSPTDAQKRNQDPTTKVITLIRRDPATNSQWNIGTITFIEPTFAGSNVRPVGVELTTPGYCRFNKGAGYDTSRPVSAGTDANAVMKAMRCAAPLPAFLPVPDNPNTFNRTVDFRRIKLSELRHTVYQRTNSWEKQNGGKTNPKAALEKSALTFDSPWLGQCTFVNGIDGNSLKLKHIIKTNSSSGDGLTANLAELRFNLGWSIFSNVKEHQRKKESEPDKLPIPKLLDSRKENFRKSLQQFREKSRDNFRHNKSRDDEDDVLKDLSNIHTPTTNHFATPRNHEQPLVSPSAHPPFSKDVDDEHRISLKLGREKAGGGFRGNSAKLGKLIVDDEGLKMCDLVVGAAMGIWWQHYEGNA